MECCVPDADVRVRDSVPRDGSLGEPFQVIIKNFGIRLLERLRELLVISGAICMEGRCYH